MPIREYRCGDCGTRFTALERSVLGVDEDKMPSCDYCGGTNNELLMSAPNLHGMPTPKYHGATPRTDDAEFQSEWNDIWKDEA